MTSLSITRLFTPTYVLASYPGAWGAWGTYWLADGATLAPYCKKDQTFLLFFMWESGFSETRFKQDYSMYTCSNKCRLMSVHIMCTPHMHVKGCHLHVLCRRFATWIKIESSDQSPLWGPIKVASKLLKSTDQRLKFDLWPLTLKNQAIKSLRREQSSDQAHFLLIKNFDCGCKRFNRWHISDYPLHVPHVPVYYFWSQYTCNELLTLAKALQFPE